MVKLGGDLGKMTKRLSNPIQHAKDLLTKPGQTVSQDIFDSLSPITSKAGSLGDINAGGKNVAKDYLAKTRADQLARQNAANDPNAGFSEMADLRNEYIKRFGIDRTSTENMLADTVSNAYQPVQQGWETMYGAAPIQANIDPAFRQYQMQLAQQLQAQAAGQGPSLAQMQLRGATDQTMNNTIANMRAATGPNAALNARSVALAGAQQMGSAANQSAMLRLQEQQNAQNALAQVSAQGRQGNLADENLRTSVANQDYQRRMSALEGLQSGIGARISGQVGTMQSALGMDAAGQEAKRKEEAARTADRRKQQNNAIGAAWTGFSTAIGSMGK